MANYPDVFKARMIRRMTGPGAITPTALAPEVGVHQTTLSRWLREAGSVDGMGNSTDQEQKERSRRPQDWTTEEKFAAVLEAQSLTEDQLGAFLRRKGVHAADLASWRALMMDGLDRPARTKGKRSAEGRRIRELEKELLRKERALAETAALLVLKKKARAIWGDADDGTPPRSGRRS